MSIFRKTIEIPLQTSKVDYVLDKYQVLNGKPISKLVIPSLNLLSYPLAIYGGSGTYTVNPTTPGNRPFAHIEAINGAYLYMTDADNRLVADQLPLMLYRQDPTYFGEKGLFIDKPCIDWTQTKIWYPSNVVPNGDNGNSILIVVEYYDK